MSDPSTSTEAPSEPWRVELVHRDRVREVRPMRGDRPSLFPAVVMFGSDLFALKDRRLTPPTEPRAWIVTYEVVDVFSVDLQRVVSVHDEETLRAAQIDAHETTALLVAAKLAETAGLCGECGAHTCACDIEVLRCCEKCTHPRAPAEPAPVEKGG